MIYGIIYKKEVVHIESYNLLLKNISTDFSKDVIDLFIHLIFFSEISVDKNKIYALENYKSLMGKFNSSEPTIKNRLSILQNNKLIELERVFNEPDRITLGEVKKGENIYYFSKVIPHEVEYKYIEKEKTVKHKSKKESYDLVEKLAELFNKNFNFKYNITTTDRNYITSTFKSSSFDKVLSIYEWYIFNYTDIDFIHSYPTPKTFAVYFFSIVKEYDLSNSYKMYESLAKELIEYGEKELKEKFIELKDFKDVLKNFNKLLKNIKVDVEKVKEVYKFYINNYKEIKFIHSFPSLSNFISFFSSIYRLYRSKKDNTDDNVDKVADYMENLFKEDR